MVADSELRGPPHDNDSNGSWHLLSTSSSNLRAKHFTAPSWQFVTIRTLRSRLYCFSPSMAEAAEHGEQPNSWPEALQPGAQQS